MATTTHIKFGDGLAVTDEGAGVIRVDGSGGPPGATGPAGAPGAAGPPGPNLIDGSTPTPLTGLLKGNGTDVDVAAAGTDYLTPSGAAAAYQPLDSDLSILATGVRAARVFHNANQSISDSTDTPLAFNTEQYDTDAIHDPAVNNSRLTCKTAGLYVISGHVDFAANATGIRQMSFMVNGAVPIALQTIATVTGGFHSRIALTSHWSLAASDYVTLNVYQSSGGPLDVVSGFAYSPHFMMTRIGT